MGRIGFWPPDAPDYGEDDDWPQPVGTGHASAEGGTQDGGESDETVVWEYQDRKVWLALKVGPFSLVIGRHES